MLVVLVAATNILAVKVGIIKRKRNLKICTFIMIYDYDYSSNIDIYF
jgi:hypothetical protein